MEDKGDEGRVALLLGRSVAGVKEKVLVRIDMVVMGTQVVGEVEISNVWHLGQYPLAPFLPLTSLRFLVSCPNNS